MIAEYQPDFNSAGLLAGLFSAVRLDVDYLALAMDRVRLDVY